MNSVYRHLLALNFTNNLTRFIQKANQSASMHFPAISYFARVTQPQMHSWNCINQDRKKIRNVRGCVPPENEDKKIFNQESEMKLIDKNFELIENLKKC
ncbi:CLUMA_CG018354, isoform A [Clunio marinus]|uniref:CLUMA_CG018354, isoform A n=1 Tax=Clunio marinus TaxID=568069 RepID=A0A1J1IZ07_9DIPT|nr:CLUMA_CG018354, isoform A [Clunio marinus]